MSAGQTAEVKLETFPFTRYGTVPATVKFLSQDAVLDEKKGSMFQARLALHQSAILVDERLITLAAGMAVTAEIKTGDRRVVDFVMHPVRATTRNSGIER